jgi:hypothetical protein
LVKLLVAFVGIAEVQGDSEAIVDATDVPQGPVYSLVGAGGCRVKGVNVKSLKKGMAVLAADLNECLERCDDTPKCAGAVEWFSMGPKKRRCQLQRAFPDGSSGNPGNSGVECHALDIGAPEPTHAPTVSATDAPTALAADAPTTSESVSTATAEPEVQAVYLLLGAGGCRVKGVNVKSLKKGMAVLAADLNECLERCNDTPKCAGAVEWFSKGPKEGRCQLQRSFPDSSSRKPSQSAVACYVVDKTSGPGQGENPQQLTDHPHNNKPALQTTCEGNTTPTASTTRSTTNTHCKQHATEMQRATEIQQQQHQQQQHWTPQRQHQHQY